MTGERLLDTSDMEAPEPLQQTLSAVDALQVGEYLRLRIRRDPVLLYPLLTVQGFDYLRRINGQTYEVIIWRHGDAMAETAIADSQRGD